MPERLGAPFAGPVLILAPTGRDAEGAAMLLSREGIASVVHQNLESLQNAIDDEAGLVLAADEALYGADLSRLVERLDRQAPWSDLPFIVLSQSGVASRRQIALLNLPARLGNLLLLERPLNAVGLTSAVKSALRARRRQRQVRDYLAERVAVAEQTAAMLEARVEERTQALELAERERQQIAAVLAQSQKMEAVGQLTGGLAHDFNNMLAGIRGSLELLETRLSQGRIEQLGRYIDMAKMGAERAAALTHRLLAFSRRQTLDPRPVAPNTLIEGMAALIRSTLGPQVVIEMLCQERLWPTLCDPHQLENALLNLSINARDAMPEGGRLTISTANVHLAAPDAAALREARPGDYAIVSVGDTGCGMSSEVLARAFDPFFTTKPLGQGTGLGLSMIYGFVQQSGGHIQIDSTPGRGTRVCLYLPRFHGSIGPEENSTPLMLAQQSGSGRVLVVDDEEALRMLIVEVLTDLGYEALQAGDGAAAMELLRHGGRIDLMITDVGMPGGMNGRQLADLARVTRPGLKVLFITGYAEAALSDEGMLQDGMQVIPKPFSVQALVDRVQALTQPDAGGTGEPGSEELRKPRF